MKNWYTITQVKPNVYALAEFHHREEVVSYLFLGDKQAYLIDTGMGCSSIKKVTAKLTDLPVVVLLTHSHWDHIGNVHEFDEVWIFNHPFEVQRVQQGFKSNDIGELQDSYFSNGFSAAAYTARGKKNPQLLHEQTVFCQKDFSIEVVHTPGHTPGSVCFWVPEYAYLFTGDTLYAGPEFLYLPESNLHDYKSSISLIMEKVSSCSNVCIFPGHNSVKENIDLLYSHHQACTGALRPITIQTGSNAYGSYQEYVYHSFSLLVPEGVRWCTAHITV